MYIETERLIIRSINPADENAYIEMASDGSLEEIFGDCSECHKWMKDWIEESVLLDKANNPNGEYLAYTIVEKERNIPIGSVGCSYYEDLNQVGITYFIGSKYRQNGYASEATAAYANYFWEQYNASGMIDTVKTVNVASCKTLEKSGFSLIETKMYCDINDTSEELYNFYESKRYFYHVVTDRPMHLGQHILFDENHHSGVYSRVMKKADLVADIYANPEKYADTALEHHTAVALRELALEEVRKEKYPMYPSRMGCLYVSKTLAEAEKWFDYFTELARPTYQIVKLKVNGNVFAGDANKCFAGCPDKQTNLRLAERYWENRPEPGQETPVIEILVDGDIEVVEIVKERK